MVSCVVAHAGRDTSRLLETACVLTRLYHVARVIVNANHRIMCAAVKFAVSDCVAGCVAEAADDMIEVLRDHRGSSQQTRLELGLRWAWLPTESD